MSIEDIKMIAAYMTANSEKEDESCAIGHCVMNKAMSALGDTALLDTIPALEDEAKEIFMKILSGKMDKDLENRFKTNLIKAGAIMSGEIKDATDGADSFSSKDSKGSKKIGSMYFSKAQPESVISEKKPSKRRKK